MKNHKNGNLRHLTSSHLQRKSGNYLMSEFSLNLFQNTTRAGFLFVKGTRMREQGSSKGEGTHRGNLCVDTQIFPNPDKSIVIYHDSKECENHNS